MFELSARLVGVYKVNHMVRTVILYFPVILAKYHADEECDDRKQRLHQEMNMVFEWCISWFCFSRAFILRVHWDWRRDGITRLGTARVTW